MGLCQRNSATGGAAKGMPLKEAMPLATVPCKRPPETLAESIAPWAFEAKATATVMAHTIFLLATRASLPPSRYRDQRLRPRLPSAS